MPNKIYDRGCDGKGEVAKHTITQQVVTAVRKVGSAGVSCHQGGGGS